MGWGSGRGVGKGHKTVLTHSSLMTERTSSDVPPCEVILLSILFYICVYAYIIIILCMYLLSMHTLIHLNGYVQRPAMNVFLNDFSTF